MLAGVINPDYHGKNVILLHNRDKEYRRYLITLFSIIMPCIEVYEKLQPNSDRTTTVQEWRFGSPLQVKNLEDLRCLLVL